MERLRARLTDVGFTVERVQTLLGPEAQGALLRNETTPAERATRDGSPLATLVRLFSLQRPEPAAAVDAALGGHLDAGPFHRAFNATFLLAAAATVAVDAVRRALADNPPGVSGGSMR